MHATYVAAAAQVWCTSPPAASGVSGGAFAVSLNGQQYTPSSAPFTYYGVPTPVLPMPRSGPHEGGTLVAFAGAFVSNGSDYRCRCNGTVVPATGPDAWDRAMRAASPDAAPTVGDAAAVRCFTPPSDASATSGGGARRRRLWRLGRH